MGHHEQVSWRFLSMVPKPLSSDLRSIGDLPAAKIKYATGDEYLDTMFRLLRANCFLKMQRGISDFISGSLDLRDMMIYNVEICGAAILAKACGFAVSLK